ncbi:MAG TPA: hypothetical protein VD969_12845 [Symbiobacteriaceae bacterium]|nr:hypothetical protein [Symbiobacteriaceae bacterium]
MSLGTWLFAFVAVMVSIAVGEQIAAIVRGLVFSAIASRRGGVVTGLRWVILTRASGPIVVLILGSAMMELATNRNVVWLLWPGIGLFSLGLVVVYATVRWAHGSTIQAIRERRTPQIDPAADEETPF